MSSAFDTRFAAAARPVSLRHNGQSITYIDADGAVTTPTVAVIHEDSREVQGANHRLQEEVAIVESATADLPQLREPAAIRVDDGEPYGFRSVVRRGGGITTAEFVRTSILETGSPTGDL